MAFDLFDSSTVKQLKAVKGEVIQTHASLQSASPGDTRAGTGRQSGHLSFLKLSHCYRVRLVQHPLSECDLEPLQTGPLRLAPWLYVPSRDKAEGKDSSSVLIGHRQQKETVLKE